MGRGLRRIEQSFLGKGEYKTSGLFNLKNILGTPGIPQYPSTDISMYYTQLDGYGNYDFSDLSNGNIWIARSGAVYQDLPLPSTGKYHLEWQFLSGNRYYSVGLTSKAAVGYTMYAKWYNYTVNAVRGLMLFDMDAKHMDLWLIPSGSDTPQKQESGLSTIFDWTTSLTDLVPTFQIYNAGSGGCWIHVIMNPDDYYIGNVTIPLPGDSVPIASLY